MPFDPAIFTSPATKEDLADVAIDVRLALNAIVLALAKLAKSEVIVDDIEAISELANNLEDKFNKLSGYHP